MPVVTATLLKWLGEIPNAGGPVIALSFVGAYPFSLVPGCLIEGIAISVLVPKWKTRTGRS